MKRFRSGINAVAVVVLAVFLLLTGVARAAEKTDKWVNSPGSDKYPAEAAIILYDNIDYTGNADGTTVLMEHEVIKILNEEGQKKYARVFRAYNRNYQKMDIQTARIIRPDGTILNLDRKKEIMNEAKFAAQLPHYKDNMILTLDYSRAQIGDAIEFKIVFTNEKPLVKRYFWTVSYINDEVPILHTIFNVKLHRDANRAKWVVANWDKNPPKPVITDIKGGKAFRWELKDRPPVTDEPAAPSFRDRVSYILFSTCPDWQDLSRGYFDAMEPFIKPDRALRVRTRKLTAKAGDDDKKLVEILRFVNAKRSIPWQFEPDHLEMFKPEMIAKSKFITKVDACLLFIAMARGAGMEAYPALISDRKHGKVFPRVPSPYQFSHLLAMVKADGKWKLIDPTHPMTVKPLLGSIHEGCTYLPLTYRGSKLKESSVSPPRANREEMISDCKLTGDGGLGVRLRFIETGNKRLFWNAIMRLMKAAGKERNVVAKMAQIINEDARVLSYNVNNDPEKDEMVMEVTFMVDQYPIVSGPFRVLKLPVTPAKNPEFLGDDLSDREYPIVIGNKSMEVKKVTFKVPDDYEIISMPPRIDITNPVGSLKVDRSFREGQFNYEYVMTINTVQVEKSQFKDLVDLYEKAFAATRETVIVRKK